MIFLALKSVQNVIGNSISSTDIYSLLLGILELILIIIYVVNANTNFYGPYY